MHGIFYSLLLVAFQNFYWDMSKFGFWMNVKMLNVTVNV